MIWFYFSLAMLALYVVMAFNPALDYVARALALFYLVLWYVAAGRLQDRFANAVSGGSYRRRLWGRPLAIAAAAGMGYLLLGAAVGLASS
jgi:hypothetical protein